jgi:hypothetical protein
MFSFSCPLPCETECSKELSHPYQDILEDFDKHLIVEAQSVAKEQSADTRMGAVWVRFFLAYRQRNTRI